MVMLPQCNSLVGHGDLGVDIFFVLSGFLIYHMLSSEYHRANGKINYLRFLWRRWLRLFPAYLVAFFLWIGVPPLNNATVPSQTVSCSKWGWTNLFFLNNLIGDENCVPVSWSIAIEFQFYIVSPLIVLGMLSQKQWGIKLPIVLAIGSIFTTLGIFLVNQDVYWQNTGGGLYNKMYTRCGPYFFGMIVSHFYSQIKKHEKSRGHSSDIVEVNDELPLVHPNQSEVLEGVILKEYFDTHNLVRYICHFIFASFWIIFTFVGPRGQQDWPLAANIIAIGFGRFFYGLGIAYYIFMGVIGHARGLNWILSWRFWTPIARLSYSLYLTQFVGLFIGTVISFNGSSTSTEIFFLLLVLSGIGIAVTLVLDLIIYLLVEKPCMDLR